MRTSTTTALVRGMAMRFAWKDTAADGTGLAGTRPNHGDPAHAGTEAGDADTPSSALLLEVDFKWLMAGYGWWVDPIRFREDPAYAARCLACARATPSAALRQCAATLQARLAQVQPLPARAS